VSTGRAAPVLTDPLLATGRGMQLAGLLLLAGAATTSWIAPARALARPVRAAALLLLSGLVVQLAGQLRALDAFAPGADPLAESLAIIASLSWGRNRLALAALAALALATAGVARPAGDRLLRLWAAAALLLLPGLGHAAAETEGLLAAWVRAVVHAAAASAWLGTLALLAPVWWHGVPSLLRSLPRYGQVALVAAPVTLLSGVATAWPRVGGIAGLVGSGYGQLVLAKATLALLLLALGARHHRRLVRARETPTRGTLLLEVAGAGAVLLVTGWLAESAPPAD
jgi:putative copper export protein